MKEYKKLGILGGMGPQASAFFYNNVIKHTEASADQEHLDMVLFNHASVPDRTEAILRGDTDRLEQVLIKDVKDLEALGCGEIVITCNTSHYFYDVMQQETGAEIINMIEEAVKATIEQFGDVKKIGIMATDGTVQMGLYGKACEKFGVEPVYPSPEKQKKVMHIIYDEIKAGQTGDQMAFLDVVVDLERQGCDAVILACTELSAYKEYHGVPDICVDAMDILVREAIVRCGGTYI
ncbi:MAG: aspartate/glutamate racemase family protein [Lachnospiraceae bacterium]|nr:aspartate/glutamate racemase family protein [Lachnospiraceae bacterium]